MPSAGKHTKTLKPWDLPPGSYILVGWSKTIHNLEQRFCAQQWLRKTSEASLQRKRAEQVPTEEQLAKWLKASWGWAGSREGRAFFLKGGDGLKKMGSWEPGEESFKVKV